MSKHKRFEGELRNVPKFPRITLTIADPIYGEPDQINEVIQICLKKARGPLLCFMRPEDIFDLKIKPEQVLHWVKPESTKNTKRKYSVFVEAIALYRQTFSDEALHWSNRTGSFTDRLLIQNHKWKKPPTLIERLIRNHYPGNGYILDPTAGSYTVEHVCSQLGIPCFSVERGNPCSPKSQVRSSKTV